MSDNPTETVDEQLAPDEMSDAHPEDEEGFDLDRALRTIKALRTEAKQTRDLRQQARQARTQLKELETLRAEKTQRDQEALSEGEKLQAKLRQIEAERDYAQQEAQDRALEYAIEREATKAGLVDPEAARALLDRSELEFDEAGRPTNVPALLKALAKAKPYLVGAPAAPSMSATNAASRQGAAQQGRRYTRSEILDRDLWASNKDDIMRAMRENRID